jgi:hypothetical protein
MSDTQQQAFPHHRNGKTLTWQEFSPRFRKNLSLDLGRVKLVLTLALVILRGIMIFLLSFKNIAMVVGFIIPLVIVYAVGQYLTLIPHGYVLLMVAASIFVAVKKMAFNPVIPILGVSVVASFFLVFIL